LGSLAARCLVLGSLLAACSCVPSSPDAGLVTREQLVSIVQGGDAHPVDCPDYLPPQPATQPTWRACFRSEVDGAGVARALVQALPSEPGADLNAELKWDLVERATLRDGCEAEVINNLRPYGLRDTAAEDGRGWSAFWILDRSACDDGTLIVLSTWPGSG